MVTVTRPRSPGRPTGDSQLQRERLLDAATDAFAHIGIHAASLRGIAQQAGVTPALVNYYFGNKERLVDALVEERLLPLFQGMAERLQQVGDDPMDLVSAFVRGMSANLSRNPWLPPLWVREVLCEGGALREMLTSRFAPMVPVLLAERFAKAQAGGRLNPDIDPRLLVVSLVGLVMLPYAAGQIWRGIFATPELGDEAMVKHIMALLERGLEVKP